MLLVTSSGAFFMLCRLINCLPLAGTQVGLQVLLPMLSRHEAKFSAGSKGMSLKAT